MVCPGAAGAVAAAAGGDTSLAALMQLAVQLCDVEAANDPEFEPYRSLYAARDLLKSVRAQLDAANGHHCDGDKQEQEKEDEERRLHVSREACVLLYLGHIGLETDELADGDSCLQQCVELCRRQAQPSQASAAEPALSPVATAVQPPAFVLTYVNALNKMGFLWTQRDNLDKSRDLLATAEKAYKAYREHDKRVPLTPAQLFNFDEHRSSSASDNASGCTVSSVSSSNQSVSAAAESSSGWHRLEEAHTLTLYYLCQVFLSGGDRLQSAVYCHSTLARQWRAVCQTAAASDSRLRWARDAATLSRFYTDQHMFGAAHHHLVAAECVLAGGGEGAQQTDSETRAQCDADVARCWSHMALTILQVSMDRLVAPAPSSSSSSSPAPTSAAAPGSSSSSSSAASASSSESFSAAAPGSSSLTSSSSSATAASVSSSLTSSSSSATAASVSSSARSTGATDLSHHVFSELDVSRCCQANQQLQQLHLPAQALTATCESFEQARLVFLCGQRACERARRHYTLHEHASDHVEVQRHLSRLYKALVFFEPDLQRQCRMYKRRIDLLAPLLAQLSVRHYLAAVRQLQYEVAEIYSDMAQCKVELQRQRDQQQRQPVTRHVVAKINQLMRESIDYFDQFLDTVRVDKAAVSDEEHQLCRQQQQEERPLPEPLDDDLIRPVLIAYFHLGHLYHRLMETELAPKLANLTRAIRAYRFIVAYCERVPLAADKMAAELDTCREMERLLRGRGDQVRAALASGNTLATQIEYK